MIVVTTVLETAHGPFKVALHEAADERCLSFSDGDLSVPGVAVRIHSSCLFGETFGAVDCDCAQQLSAALAELTRRSSGALIYMFQEGRGAGLERKIRGMELQRTIGLNSYGAYKHLGLPRDLRDYSMAVEALKDLGVANQIALMSSNPEKRSALEAFGYDVQEQIALAYQVDRRAYGYLLMKQQEGSHLLDLENIVFTDLPG